MTHMLRWKPLDGDNIRNPYKMYEQLRSTEPVFLSQTHVQLKLATASGILVLSLTLNTAQAQTTANGPFASQPRHINPLREPFKFDGTTFPATIDLDKDGDYDLLVGDEGNYYYSYYGYNNIDPLRYLLNVGTNAEPKFEEKRGAENPFNDLEIVNRYRGPVFADIDKDGDQDLFVGTRNWDGGQILFFKNNDLLPYRSRIQEK